MFDKPITLSQFVLGYLGHRFVLARHFNFGIFQFGFMENQGRAAGLLLIVIVISLAGQSIVQDDLAYLRMIPYVASRLCNDRYAHSC